MYRVLGIFLITFIFPGHLFGLWFLDSLANWWCEDDSCGQESGTYLFMLVEYNETEDSNIFIELDGNLTLLAALVVPLMDNDPCAVTGILNGAVELSSMPTEELDKFYDQLISFAIKHEKISAAAAIVARKYDIEFNDCRSIKKIISSMEADN